MSRWKLNNTDRQLIEMALQEDLGPNFQDVTTLCLFNNQPLPREAKIISKHKTAVIFCGTAIITAILDYFNTPFVIHSHFQEGALIPPQSKILVLQCQASTLLMAERTILNFLRRLCAIATLTHAFVEKVKPTQLKILDTRKTTPGWRHLEKYAVQCGGGVNHRLGLYDTYMIKDTHVDLLGGMEQALKKLPCKESNTLPVIVEVRSLQELQTVLNHGQNKVDRILLDNMSPELLAECVKLCKNIIPTEASGNLSLENILAVAESGVNYASIGMLTHSANSVDISMQI